MTTPGRPGPTNSLVDVAGLRVGHATRDEPGWLTGVTVVVTPPGGAVAGVDVRGGGPGTRETDLLDPRNLVDRVDAVVLGGGSAFGLAAADGVMRGLAADGRGWAVGAGGIVPIVPAAILFDLGRGGTWGHHPGPDDGLRAYTDASGPSGASAPADASAPVAPAQGGVGAGTGARVGGLKGGVGSASAVLDTGETVAAIVALNAVGSVVDPATGVPWATGLGLEGEFDAIGRPDEADLSAARARADELAAAAGTPSPGIATTIGVVATDATLSKAQCARLAAVAHDGLARAVRPVHTLFDGDTMFGLSTRTRPAPDPQGLVALMEAGAGCVGRAIVHAVLAATSVDRTADGGVALRSWRDAFPSAVRGAGAPPSEV